MGVILKPILPKIFWTYFFLIAIPDGYLSWTATSSVRGNLRDIDVIKTFVCPVLLIIYQNVCLCLLLGVFSNIIIQGVL